MRLVKAESLPNLLEEENRKLTNIEKAPKLFA